MATKKKLGNRTVGYIRKQAVENPEWDCTSYCKENNYSLDVVKNLIEQARVKAANSVSVEDGDNRSNSQKTLANQFSLNNSHGVAIMSQGASQMGDDIQKMRGKSWDPSDFPHMIHIDKNAQVKRKKG